MRRLIDEHATIIFLSNGREGGRGYREVVPIMVTRIIFGPEPDLPRAHARPKPSDLATWNGTVALDGGVEVESRVRDGAVWLTASNQEGMFRISGADSLARSRALSLNGLAATVADSLLRGGDHSLDSTFSPSLVESGRPEFFRLWRAIADTLGAPARTEVLGSLSTSPIMGRTVIRVQGSRGHRILNMDWLDGHLIRSTPVESNGLSLRFVPESRSRLSRYDLWTARTIRVDRG